MLFIWLDGSEQCKNADLLSTCFMLLTLFIVIPHPRTEGKFISPPSLTWKISPPDSAAGFNSCPFRRPGQKVCFHECSATWGFSHFRCFTTSHTTPRSRQHFQSSWLQLHNCHCPTSMRAVDSDSNTLFHHYFFFWNILMCYFGPIPKFPVANYHYNGTQEQHPLQ